jgi:hypothetical protein
MSQSKTWRPVIVLASLLDACHHSAPPQQPQPVVVAVGRSVSADTLRQMEQKNAAAGVSNPMSRADSVARQTARITAEPDSFSLRAGESKLLRWSFRFTAYDSTGAPLVGFVPFIEIDDQSTVTLRGPSLVGLQPGVAHLTVSPMVFDTSQPRPPVHVVVTVNVVP